MKPIFLLAAAALYALPLTTRAEDGIIVSDGVALHFTDEGAGPTVILLHAFAGSSTLWKSSGLMPLDGFRTISFDARGHGASGKPLDAGAYGMPLVEDVIRLMDARGVAAAHVVGYSMGAETALKLAVTHPERVRSLVVGGSGWSSEAEVQTYGAISAALGDAATFGDFMAAMAPDPAGTTEADMLAGFAMLTDHGISPGQDAAPLAAAAGGMHALIGLTAAELFAIDVPVLGLAGGDDPERENVARLGTVLDDFTFVPIPGADHLAAPLTPLFTQTVIAFLRD
ncbi:MAG: alpha/beta fold hydrolase [Limimaricola sp.]|uniref:alpha/beta fold hydrolase n=1 Tax=Limimaricola sp. TaxID=2211665 RepID=UPI001D28D732|nr:alpha/beta hydrolase [Limimaricola sp.]MBI1418884.1 alpha/beta fold hydrolase [Limimaricola sp.]